MKVAFSLGKSELDNFAWSCEAALRNVGTGSKKALIAACEEIMGESMAQVPTDTYTLLMSAFYDVRRRDDTSKKVYAYEATLGYGGNGQINPKTGRPASEYMLAVHEDLSAVHPHGKAKYLEDPVRDYGRTKFARTVFTYMQESLR